LALRRVSKETRRTDGGYVESRKVGNWPGPEILTINLIAENQPFDSTWHEKFGCNSHRRQMADSTQWGTRRIAAIEKLVVSANVGFLAQGHTHPIGQER